MKEVKPIFATVIDAEQTYPTYWSFFSKHHIIDLFKDNIYQYGATPLRNGDEVEILFLGNHHQYNNKVAVVQLNKDMGDGLKRITLIDAKGLKFNNAECQDDVQINITINVNENIDVKRLAEKINEELTKLGKNRARL